MIHLNAEIIVTMLLRLDISSLSHPSPPTVGTTSVNPTLNWINNNNDRSFVSRLGLVVKALGLSAHKRKYAGLTPRFGSSFSSKINCD